MNILIAQRLIGSEGQKNAGEEELTDTGLFETRRSHWLDAELIVSAFLHPKIFFLSLVSVSVSLFSGSCNGDPKWIHNIQVHKLNHHNHLQE